MTTSFRFAVLFDTHYCLESPAGLPAGHAEISDVPRYAWMREHLFPSLVEELKAHQPDLCVCTGDLGEGSKRLDPEMRQRELTEPLARFRQAGLRIVSVKGNHDPERLYKETVLPWNSTELEQSIAHNFFCFDTPGGRFVAFDEMCLSHEDPQTPWLQRALTDIPPDAPAYLFGHAPYSNFARPFFVEPQGRPVLRNVMEKRTPTILFCGHTHNQALTYHYVTEDRGFAQIKGSTVGYPDIQADRLEDRHLLLLEAADIFYWGVPEDHWPGYWIMDVTGNDVVGSWYGIRHGLLGRARFHPDGRVPEILQEPAFLPSRLRMIDLPLIRSAMLEVFLCGDPQGDFALTLNGVPLGSPAANGNYAARRAVPLSKRAIRSLLVDNELSISPGSTDSWLFGSARIVAETQDGRRLTTSIPPQLLVSGDYAEMGNGLPPEIRKNFRVVAADEVALQTIRIGEPTK